MADQDAQDISQMMSATSDVAIGTPKKSKFLWVVLGCVVFGVGLGIVVYQQSIKAPATVKTTPRPSVVAIKPSPVATQVASSSATPVIPNTSVVTPLANTMTFPQAGKLRVYSSLNNVQLVVTVTTGGQTKNITLTSRATTTNKMNYTDATFDVTAGSTGTINAYVNSVSGEKMGGWIEPTDNSKCGVSGGQITDFTAELTWAQANLASGKTIFAKQCWADSIIEGDPSSNDFNDFFLVWSYSAASTTASASPSSSATASVSPSPSPSASVKASASPSPSVKASTTATPTPSPRVTMPDTTDGTPVTGVFEVTVGTISVGLILLVLGLFGLIVL